MDSEDNDPLSNFMYALKSEDSKKKYPQRLKFFFNHILENEKDFNSQIIEFMKNADSQNWVYSKFIKFIIAQNKRVQKGEITAGTVRNYYKAAKLFCEMNDVVVNWKKITKGMLREKQYGDDRAPTLDEIRKLMEYPDRRLKPIVLVMVSSGIRAGAWDYLRWKHIIPIVKDGQLIAAKIIVYAGEPESYYSFITAEAYHALKEWMDFRVSYGEEISGDSWLMRDTWQKIDTKHSSNIGMINYPNQLTSKGIKSLMDRAIRTQKLDILLKKGNNHNTRREWKALHGFRKVFNSTMINSNLNFTVKEKLMGHDLKLDNSYFKGSEEDLLQEYLKAVNSLTINEEHRLRQKVEKLEIERSQIEAIAAEIEMLKRKIK
jgi:integrase